MLCVYLCVLFIFSQLQYCVHCNVCVASLVQHVACSSSQKTFWWAWRNVCSISQAGVYSMFDTPCMFDTKCRSFAQFRESSVSTVCPAEVWAASAGGPRGVEAEGKLSSLNEPSLSDLIRSTSAPETFSSWPTRRGELKPRFNYHPFIFPHVKGCLSAHRAVLQGASNCVRLCSAYASILH